MASDEAYILVSRWYKSARAQSYREPLDSGPLEPCLYRGKLHSAHSKTSAQKARSDLELAQCAPAALQAWDVG